MRIRITALYQYILIYVLMIFTGSIGFRISNDFFVLMSMFLGLCFIITKKNKVPGVYYLFLTMLTITLAFEMLITEWGVNITSFVSILSRYFIIMTAFYYDEAHFCERYVRISVLLAFISLVGFGLVQIIPTFLKSVLPCLTETVSTYWGKQNAVYYGRYLFAFQSSAARNIGIYHEPGLYQIVLNSTLYCLLYKKEALYLNDGKRKQYIAVILLTILTTMSTTAYIVSAMLIVIYFLGDSEGNKKNAFLVMIIVSVILSVYNAIAGTESIFYEAVFSKITNSTGKFDLTVSTGKSRIMSLLADLQVFVRNPLGIGYSKYNETWSSFLIDSTISDVSSCVGLTQILAILGMVVFVVIIGFYLFLSRKNLGKAEKFAFWFMFLNICLSQPQIWYPPLIVLLLINDKRIQKLNRY